MVLLTPLTKRNLYHNDFLPKNGRTQIFQELTKVSKVNGVTIFSKKCSLNFQFLGEIVQN